MGKPLLLVLLFAPVMVLAQATSAPMRTESGGYPAILHQRLGPSCELIRAVTLIEYEQFDALTFAGATDEIYSPELDKGDFVGLSATVPKKVAKSAKKSGFDVHVGSTDPSGLSAKSTTNGSSCTDLQQALADADNRRRERRSALQRRVHQAGFDALPPVPIEQVQPSSVVNEGSVQSSRKPKVKEGIAILAMVIGADGKVYDVHVVESLNVELDQKAIEAVRQWKFLPGRMKGLPVPVQINVVVNFRLH